MLSRPSGCTPVTAGGYQVARLPVPLTVAAKALCEHLGVEVCICLSLCILLFSFQNLISLCFVYFFSPLWVRHESVSKIKISGAAAWCCSAARQVFFFVLSFVQKHVVPLVTSHIAVTPTGAFLKYQKGIKLFIYPENSLKRDCAETWGKKIYSLWCHKGNSG